MSDNSLYLKVGQVAEMLEMNVATIYNKCKSGEIPSIKVGEKAVRIPRAAFDAYLSKLHGEATAHQGRGLLDAVYARADDPRAALERQALNFSNRVGCSAHEFVDRWRDRKMEDTPQTTELAIEALSLQQSLDRLGIREPVPA